MLVIRPLWESWWFLPCSTAPSPRGTLAGTRLPIRGLQPSFLSGRFAAVDSWSGFFHVLRTAAAGRPPGRGILWRSAKRRRCRTVDGLLEKRDHSQPGWRPCPPPRQVPTALPAARAGSQRAASRLGQPGERPGWPSRWTVPPAPWSRDKMGHIFVVIIHFFLCTGLPQPLLAAWPLPPDLTRPLLA